MSSYQEQAEEEMWDAASTEHAPREYAYDVIVSDTGARCLSTDSLLEARTRADAVGGYVTNRFEQCVYTSARPDYDPRIDHPERYGGNEPNRPI